MCIFVTDIIDNNRYIRSFDASSDDQKGAVLERINEFGAIKGLNFTPRVNYLAFPPLAQVASTDSKDKGKMVPAQLSAEDMSAWFEGHYAQILDGVPANVIAGREGVVYNDKHQPQAWRGMLLVYLPLLPVRFSFSVHCETHLTRNICKLQKNVRRPALHRS
jgi:hypothetical protein